MRPYTREFRKTLLGAFVIRAAALRSAVSPVLGVALLLSVTACVKRETNPRLVARQANEMQSASAPASAPGQRQTRVNLNSASANELETLPGIGHGLAERIIEHRQKYGPFRRPEHLLIVRGISDKRFRALQELITVE